MRSIGMLAGAVPRSNSGRAKRMRITLQRRELRFVHACVISGMLWLLPVDSSESCPADAPAKRGSEDKKN